MPDTKQKVDLLPKMLMQNGSTVIQFHPTKTNADGEHMVGVVIAVYRDEYVTWRVGRDTWYEAEYNAEAVWFAEMGHYFDDLTEAAIDFTKRCERGF